MSAEKYPFKKLYNPSIGIGNEHTDPRLLSLSQNISSALNGSKSMSPLALAHQSLPISSSFLSDAEYYEQSVCLDIVFNFLVAHVTKEGPIKVTQRKKTVNGNQLSSYGSSLTTFSARQKCFYHLLRHYDYIPLIKSISRFDPLLFKDHVSAARKKYRKIESVSWGSPYVNSSVGAGSHLHVW